MYSMRLFVRVAAVFLFLGGVLLGGSMAVTASLSGEAPNSAYQIGGGCVASLFGAVFGGALGLIEGLIIGLPLAGALELFGNGQ
jgi:hypothetical protein